LATLGVVATVLLLIAKWATAGVHWMTLYRSEVQSLYALLPVSTAFLAYLLATWPDRDGEPQSATPELARFVRTYALVFTVVAILDPVVGGPVMRALGLADTTIATSTLFTFVLLGDFRVFLLVFAVPAIAMRSGAPRAAAAEAAGWTLVVPLATGLTYPAGSALAGGLPDQWLWLLYELGFIAMAVVVRARVVPLCAPMPAIARYLRSVMTFAIAYYALWAAADVVILLLRADVGWALRLIPNQLYYALFVPYAYSTFFARR
jgi:hypothetical protein